MYSSFVGVKIWIGSLMNTAQVEYLVAIQANIIFHMNKHADPFVPVLSFSFSLCTRKRCGRETFLLCLTPEDQGVLEFVNAESKASFVT